MASRGIFKESFINKNKIKSRGMNSIFFFHLFHFYILKFNFYIGYVSCWLMIWLINMRNLWSCNATHWSGIIWDLLNKFLLIKKKITAQCSGKNSDKTGLLQICFFFQIHPFFARSYPRTIQPIAYIALPQFMVYW